MNKIAILNFVLKNRERNSTRKTNYCRKVSFEWPLSKKEDFKGQNLTT